jgi:hypothetical protein
VSESARSKEEQLRAEAEELRAAAASATTSAAAQVSEMRERMVSEVVEATNATREAVRAECELQAAEVLADAQADAQRRLEDAVAAARREFEAVAQARVAQEKDHAADQEWRQSIETEIDRPTVETEPGESTHPEDGRSEDSLTSETDSEASSVDDVDGSSTNMSSVLSADSVDRKADVEAAKRHSAAVIDQAAHHEMVLGATPVSTANAVVESETQAQAQAQTTTTPQHNAVCDTCELPFYTASGKSTCVDCRKPAADSTTPAQSHTADPHDGEEQRTPGQDSIILDEAIVEHEATEEEVFEYARWLGMDPEVDHELMWIAHEGIDSKLPAEWKPCKSPAVSEEIYYFNFETGESTWDHPSDEYYKTLYRDEKRKLKERNSKSAAEEKMALLWDGSSADGRDAGSADSGDISVDESPQRSVSVSFGPTVERELDTLNQATTPVQREQPEALVQTPEQAEATELRRRAASLFEPPAKAEEEAGSTLDLEALERLEVGARIEVQNRDGVWTVGEVVKNRTKKHSGQLKIHYDGTKKKKDEWLPYGCGRFGGLSQL